MKLLRLDYLLHRWLGTCLGALVFVWFASGIVMAYYPYPSIPESRELHALRPFAPDSGLIGFSAAWSAAQRAMAVTGDRRELVRGRLQQLGTSPVYQFQLENGVPIALVDARTGTVLSPIDSRLAETSARALVPGDIRATRIELLHSADHYMLDVAYAPQFPAWRVRFDDPGLTAVYVNARGGNPFGVVTRFTRLTTWTGTVPHWFYFIWLYDRPGLWSAAFVVAGSGILGLALTGIVWGFYHLARGKTYRGISKWHHFSGIGFGFLVLTWTASGLYQNFGAGSGPGSGQAARIRGGPTRWTAVQVPEWQALARLRQTDSTALVPSAVDLVQLDGHPGYQFFFSEGRSLWVDAESGAPRGELTEPEVRRAAALAMESSDPPRAIERLSRYDEYYYVRHGREMHLPVWRISFADREASRLYLDPVSGTPLAFVGRAARRARWLRDAVHSLDLPALNNRRPLWDLVILPLLACGLVLSGTGVWLALRRWRRS
ncbi:MAG TPA: hypothetical protein VGP87_08820 [Gemmatimonadales bacterium]|nr:hypothetical protein [Gemmatimonadales bacterium]